MFVALISYFQRHALAAGMSGQVLQDAVHFMAKTAFQRRSGIKNAVVSAIARVYVTAKMRPTAGGDDAAPPDVRCRSRIVHLEGSFRARFVNASIWLNSISGLLVVDRVRIVYSFVHDS
jgi:hypothetical protein